MKRFIVALSLLLVSAGAENILLTKRGGVYEVPGVINGKVHLEFIVDSGASLVYISQEVFDKLKALGTIGRSDILGSGKSRIANGTLVDTLFINLKTLKIGQSELRDVKAGVGGSSASILLGQSALKRFEPWHIDTQRNLLSITSHTKTAKMYVSSSSGISRGEALAFVNHYFSVQNSRDVGMLPSLYADTIDYHGTKGVLKKNILMKKEVFFRTWEQIHINLIQFISSKSIKHHPDRVAVKYKVMFELRNHFTQKGKRGQAIVSLVLEKRGKSIRIISENEKVISEKRFQLSGF